MSALEAYLKDVADPGKDFPDGDEWFCWATFQRLTARKCCAEWLRAAAKVLGGDAKAPLTAAADHYERAFESYSAYDKLVHAEEGPGVRTAEGKAAIAPLLRDGIEAERAAIAQLAVALRALGEEVPMQPGATPATAAGAPTAAGPAAGGAQRVEHVTLAGCSYEIRPVTPENLVDIPRALAGTCGLRMASDVYGQNLDPIYNIHCQLLPEGQQDLPARFRPGDEWGAYWEELAQGLTGRTDCFALVAYADGKQAGYVRFFPRTVAMASWVPEGGPGAPRCGPDRRRPWPRRGTRAARHCVRARAWLRRRAGLRLEQPPPLCRLG